MVRLRMNKLEMTVVVIMPLGNARGGGEQMLLHLLREGQGQGIRWHVVFLESGEMSAQVLALGVGVDVLEAGRMRETHKLLSTSQKIAQIARSKGASLILGWMETAHVYGSIASAISKIPAAWYQLDVLHHPTILDKIISALPAKFIMTLSQEGALKQQKLSHKTPIVLVHPGADLKKFSPALLPTTENAKKQLGLPENKKIIGIVGRLQRWKGMHNLIDAMFIVKKRHLDAIAVIVGGRHAFEEEYEDYLKEKIRDLDLDETVLMVGFQSDVPLWMQSLDIFVHASDQEPFGIVIIEAFALGKSVIATDKGGPLEIITPEVDGILTPYGDINALADAISTLLDKPDYAKQLGDAAHNRARDFTAEKFAKNFIAKLHDFL